MKLLKHHAVLDLATHGGGTGIRTPADPGAVELKIEPPNGDRMRRRVPNQEANGERRTLH